MVKKEFLLPELRVIPMDIIETQATVGIEASLTGSDDQAPHRSGSYITDFD